MFLYGIHIHHILYYTYIYVFETLLRFNTHHKITLGTQTYVLYKSIKTLPIYSLLFFFTILSYNLSHKENILHDTLSWYKPKMIFRYLCLLSYSILHNFLVIIVICLICYKIYSSIVFILLYIALELKDVKDIHQSHIYTILIFLDGFPYFHWNFS